MSPDRQLERIKHQTNSESYESWETDYDILRFIVKTAVMAHSPAVCECMFVCVCVCVQTVSGLKCWFFLEGIGCIGMCPVGVDDLLSFSYKIYTYYIDTKKVLLKSD